LIPSVGAQLNAMVSTTMVIKSFKLGASGWRFWVIEIKQQLFFSY
jgi:hypothetical protein